MITLTVAEIIDLAECAGIALDKSVTYDEDELEAAMTIVECPVEGLLGDDNKRTHYKFIAYISDYPDEGSFALGKELPKSTK